MLYAIDSVRKTIDQKPLGLPLPEELSLEEITKERSFEETAQPPTRPAKKRRRLRCSKRPVFKRRRRVVALIFILLVVLAAGGLLFLNNASWMESEPLEQVMAPSTAEEGSNEEPSGEAGTEEKEAGTTVPEDPALYMTVPRLGLYDHTVRNEESEAALDLGAVKLPQTDFPWQKGANTYIACHRLGWPGTESYNQCLNLPSMQKGDEVILKDANGTVYKYRVVETLIVGPDDTWVTDPVAGKDIVSLQTCIEAPDDLYTLGPNWAARFVVRAERTEEEQTGSFRRLVGESVTAYAGLLHTPSFSYFGSVLRTVKRAVW